MYAKSIRPSAKREVQKERSAKRDDRIARPRRAQTCERSELRAKRAMRMCPRSGQIFLIKFLFSPYQIISKTYISSELKLALINLF